MIDEVSMPGSYSQSLLENLFNVGYIIFYKDVATIIGNIFWGVNPSTNINQARGLIDSALVITSSIMWTNVHLD